MYRLYAAPGAASLCVHWMLIELGVPFELVAVDLDAERTPELLALNPAGQVPVLVVDGRPVCESAAILMLLAERHPEAGLAPVQGSAERAEWLEWMVRLANGLLPPFRRWFYAERTMAPAHVEAFKDEARAAIEAFWARTDAMLADGRPFLLGDRMSTADFLLTMLTRWSRNMTPAAAAWPRLGAYIARMRAMPSLKEVHAREGLAEWING